MSEGVSWKQAILASAILMLLVGAFFAGIYVERKRWARLFEGIGEAITESIDASQR